MLVLILMMLLLLQHDTGRRRNTHTPNTETPIVSIFILHVASQFFIFTYIFLCSTCSHTHPTTPYRTSKRKQQQQLHPMILPHTSYIYIYTLYIHYIYHIIHYMSIIANLLLHNAMHIYVISCIVPFHLQ